MKIQCTDYQNSTYSFIYSHPGATTREFTLDLEEIEAMKTQQWPTLPDRYEFGVPEIVIGKLVLTLDYAYGGYSGGGQLNGKTLELTETKD